MVPATYVGHKVEHEVEAHVIEPLAEIAEVVIGAQLRVAVVVDNSVRATDHVCTGFQGQ